MKQITEDDPIIESQKFCPQCKKNVETYWELLFCDKNIEGLSENLGSHGNEIDGTTTCEDDYCNPSETQVELSDDPIERAEYINTHEVFERCSNCHQFWESMV